VAFRELHQGNCQGKFSYRIAVILAPPKQVPLSREPVDWALAVWVAFADRWQRELETSLDISHVSLRAVDRATLDRLRPGEMLWKR
jgi:hypothetical protein